MSFKSWLGKSLLTLRGFEIVGDIPPEIKKCVVIEAPHTCIEDFFIGLFFFWAKKKQARFLMKQEFFSNKFNRKVLTHWGAIPVDRSSHNHVVLSVSALFPNFDELYVVITPEGTRKRVERWKKGFYYIANKAEVPIVLGFIDYQKKRCGFGPILNPSGDYDADWKKIEDFYRGMKGKYPEKFNL